MKQIKFQLKNKMKVILVPSHKSPVVSVQMWVKTGSADEQKGEEGISHFIEHLVFKGTNKYKVGEIASTVEASGGELNAYTSFDQTVFYVTISKNFKDVALDVISEMMGYPTFDPAEVDSEREVVCEEIKMGQDSAGRQASQVMFQSVFKKHSYGKPVIGYEKNVRSWSVKKIRSYYQSRYVPQNMYLLVSGDFETAEMKALVKEKFEKFVPYKLTKKKRIKEPSQKKLSIVTKTKDLKETTYNLSFKAPSATHKDIPAIEAMMMILGQGDTSRLFNEMKIKANLVNAISAYAYTPKDQGLLTISFKQSDQDYKTAVAKIWENVEKLKRHEVSWEELRRIVIGISSDQFYGIETVDGIASKVGNSEFYYNDSYAHEKFLKQTLKITPKDIMRVAKKYFDPKTACFSALGPETEKQLEAKLKSTHADWLLLQKAQQKIKSKSEKNKKVKIPKLVFKAGSKDKKYQPEVIITKKGTKIIFLRDADIPTTSAKIIMGGGVRIEDESKLGLTELFRKVYGQSTHTKSEEEVLRIIEDCAAGFSSFSGKNSFGFSIDYMKPFEKTILDLAEDILLNSKYEKEIFDREKTNQLRAIKNSEDQQSFLAAKLFTQTMFQKHPMSFISMGSENTVDAITIDDLKAYQKQIFKSKNTLITVVGDFDQQQWLKLVHKMEETFEEGSKLLPSYPIAPLLKNERVFLEKKDKEQSHVIIGWRGLSFTHADRYILEVIQAILSGQGGRLFIELRDKNSLAYSVSPMKQEGIETGYFGGYIACSPDKVEKAIQMFEAEFKKIVDIKVGHDELERAKRYIIGQHDISLQRKSTICNTILFDEFYGNDYRDSLNVAHLYQSITSDDVQRVAKDLFTKKYVIAVVGKK